METNYPLLKIEIIGINERGHEVSNAQMYSGRQLPWLQDVDSNGNNVSDVWYDRWQVGYRDVVILDGANVRTGVYNLTENNLADSSAYAELREQLLDAALANQKPWQNPDQPLDCDLDGFIVPRDVLLVINEINRGGARKLPAPTGTSLPSIRYDANGDGFVTSNDVLQIVNHINSVGNAGEGEAAVTQLDPPIHPNLVIAAPLTLSDAPADDEVCDPLEADYAAPITVTATYVPGTAVPRSDTDHQDLPAWDVTEHGGDSSTDPFWDDDWLAGVFL